jgi:hypothetical protein
LAADDHPAAQIRGRRVILKRPAPERINQLQVRHPDPAALAAIAFAMPARVGAAARAPHNPHSVNRDRENTRRRRQAVERLNATR